uniref:Putative glycosyltransferase n=1 Tax=Streptococcus suis TaxID=1307 RepID=V9M0Y5_STRSU|nr:putative glycosyltransferase [Streptococcus suis]
MICPHFMGYDEILVEELKKRYSVTFLDSDLFLKKARDEYNNLPIIIKFIFKIIKPFRNYYRESLLDNALESNFPILIDNEFDLILSINGDGLSDDFYKILFSRNKSSKKFLYIWDDFDWLFKSSHIKYFDRVSTYNLEDSQKFGFSYLPVFTKPIFFNSIPQKKIDISIVATANQKRVDFIRKFYEKNKEKYSFYIYLYDKNMDFNFFSNSNPLSYDEYQKILSQSVSTLDIVRFGQRGPTTRVFDSLVTKTKIITANKEIINYPINSANVFILDSEFEIPEDFIKSDFVEGQEALMVDDWLKTIEN